MNQETALSICKTGVNIFLTGEPGSGKTHTINQYISWLRERGIEPAVTASTGIAATHIGGHTIHSWSGLGARTVLSEYELEALHEKEAVWRRVTGANVLIIEEVSMLDARALESVDAILRLLRKQSAPFGGMQIVLVGDFFQLPPVSTDAQMTFAFDSLTWRQAKPVTLYLTEQYRQEDSAFLDLLSAIRAQRVTSAHQKQLNERQCNEANSREYTATKLYAHNADVDRINAEELARLSGEAHVFTMKTNGPKALVGQLMRGCLSPEELALKEGAVVMFTKNNHEAGFVNGTLGTVVEFAESGMPVVETYDGEEIVAEPVDWKIEEDGNVRAWIEQVPLRLAWAITVHKSQGMSLDAAFIDLGKAFEYGQGYVALSRVRTLAGLHLQGFNERALEVHPKVARQDDWFRRHACAVEEKFTAQSAEAIDKRKKAFVEAVGGSWEAVPDKQRGKQRRATHEITHELLADGMGLAEIAQERELTHQTVFRHLEKLREDGVIAPADIAHVWEEMGRDNETLERIHDAFREHGTARLRPVYDHFEEAFSFDELRTARLLFSS